MAHRYTFQEQFAGERGFEALKVYIRDANDFCKDVSSIMHERSEAENQYAKVLTKLGGKLNKASAFCMGSLRETFLAVAYEMEQEADIHRQLGQALHEDLTKAMKNLVEAQNKTRKTIENPVDKAYKMMMDKRSDENKAKNKAHTSAANCEQAHEHLSAVCSSTMSKSQRPNTSSERKEVQKAEKKAQQAEEHLKKVDREYMIASQMAESARQNWENSMSKAAFQLQSLEEERITQMKDFLGKYRNNMALIETQLLQCCEKLKNLTLNLDIIGDIQVVAAARRTGQQSSEQILPDYYAEDSNNLMNPDRRRQTLQRYFAFLRQELDRERAQIRGIHEQLNSSPPECDAHREAKIRLLNVTDTVNYLEASLFKVNSTLAQMLGREPHPYRYSTFISRNREKGYITSKLRIPNSIVLESTTTTTGLGPGTSSAKPGGSPIPGASSARAPANYSQDWKAGKEAQSAAQYSPPSDSSAAEAPQPPPRNSKNLEQVAPPPGPDEPPPPYEEDDRSSLVSELTLSHCRALGTYTGHGPDELNLKEGDMVTVYKKHDDGWWYGEVNGRYGLFPSLCVKEYAPKV